MHDKKHQSGRKHRRDHQAAVNIVGSSLSSSLEGKNAGQKHHRGRQHRQLRRDHRRHSASSLVVSKVTNTHTRTHTHTHTRRDHHRHSASSSVVKKGGRKKRSSWYHSLRHPRFGSRIVTIVIIIINIKYPQHRNHKQHRVHRRHRQSLIASLRSPSSAASKSSSSAEQCIGVGLSHAELGSTSMFFARDALDVALALPKAPQASKV